MENPIAYEQEDQENTGRHTPLVAQGSSRRSSDQGLLSKMSESNTTGTKRRQTIAVEPSGTKKNSMAPTPSKTPSKHRLNLGAASSYYFKGVTKTPFETALSAKKKLNSSIQMDQSFTADQSVDVQLAGYNGESVADESFMTLGGETASSDGSDILNKSTLSDTTELTASNFVFATSSRQLLSHSHSVQRAPEQTYEKEQVQVVAPSLVLTKDTESAADVSSRFPLDTINANNKRRNTLPPGIIGVAPIQVMHAQASTTAVPGGGAVARRESWQGPSPRPKVNMSPGSLRNFAATMRNSRLKRQQERDEDVSRRLSVGSVVSTTVEVASAKQAKAHTQRFSLASSTADISIRLPSLSPSFRAEFSMPSTEEKAQEEQDAQEQDEESVSLRSLDNLFADMLPERDGETSVATGRGSGTGDGETAELLDTSFASETSVATGRDSGNEDGETAELLDTSFASETSVAAGHDSGIGGGETDGETADFMDISFASVANSGQDSGTVTSRTSVSPASTVTTAPSLSNSTSWPVATSTSTGKSPGPLPSDIAFKSADSPAKSLRVEATSPFRPGSAKTTTTPTKMTPTKLTGSARRVPASEKATTPTKMTPTKLTGSARRVHNPKSFDSPAKNTRSASRTSMGSSKDDYSSGKRMRDDEEDDTSSGQEGIRGVIEYAQTLDFSVVNDSKRRKSSVSSTVLHSSLRKAVPSSLRKAGNVKSARKTVAFGSPEFMEFNKGSPSKSWTPLPKKMARQMNTMVDSTVEIEADMNALLSSVGADPVSAASKVNAYQAGSTPVASNMSSLDEDTEATVELESNVQDLFSQPPIASKMSPPDNTEATVELESNVQDLFSQPPIASKMSPLDNTEATVELESSVQDLFAHPPIVATMSALDDAEATVELESTVQDLFAQPQEALDSRSEISVDSPTDQMDITEPDQTVDLEVDMASLLAVADTKKHQSSRHSISRLEMFSESDDDTMSMDIDTSKFGGELKADEDNTIELECDMQALLGAAAGGKANQLQLSMSDSPATIGSRPRRSSVSTGRFSLAPQSRLSLTAEGEVIVNDLSHIEQTDYPMDSSVASISPARAVEAVDEVLDLNEVELFLASGLTVDARRDTSDILTEVSESAQALVMPVTTDAMNTILAEVCKEVDARIDPEVDLGTLLSSCDENREHYLTLQKALRSRDQDVCGQLERLAETVRIEVESEWLDWLVSVTESLKGPFDGMEEDIHETESRINGATELISDTREILSTMESKAIQKAKRKSLDGRMVAISSLEEEIADMEAQLERSKGYMASVQTEHEVVADMTNSLSTRSQLTSELSGSRAAAESSEAGYSTITGINKWRPMELDESELSFQLVGPSPKTCVFISFQVTDIGPIACKARIQPNLYPKHKARSSMRFETRSIASFLEQRAADVCAMACKERLDTPSQIGAFLRRLEWELGRAEHTAVELAMLERRYKADISPNPSSVELTVEFASKTRAAKLLATFELSAAYPFSPLNVCLDAEGQVDVEAMRKLLIKNAKPGFGYLSRNCDVIAAYLR